MISFNVFISVSTAHILFDMSSVGSFLPCLSGCCFHPWCPDGHSGRQAGGGKKFVRVVSVRCRKLILCRDIG